MSHVRTAIRSALAQLLTDTVAGVAGKVFVTRTAPLRDADLPALLVYSGAAEPLEDSVLATGAPLGWRWRLRIDVVVKEALGAETAADALAAQIESALFSPPGRTLGGLVQSLKLVEIGEVELDDGLEKLVLRLPIHLEVLYLQGA